MSIEKTKAYRIAQAMQSRTPYRYQFYMQAIAEVRKLEAMLEIYADSKNAERLPEGRRQSSALQFPDWIKNMEEGIALLKQAIYQYENGLY
ncbi:hypothetical protein [Persicobacter diffluens]|uniref:Uncharacterized protein n=1 Tax=Persicobacter diffluens TaxID=981 RepID=A0AAN5AN61_9BACT|nr:hypothetical protein PEDI_30850 [Persicobacter diffluens]